MARVTLQIPADAQTSPEALSLWLRSTQGLDAQVIRKGPPGGGKEGAKGGERRAAKRRARRPKWTLSGGTAKDAWSLDYTPGKPTAEVKHTQNDTLAVVESFAQGRRRRHRLEDPRRQFRHRDVAARPVRHLDVGARTQREGAGRQRARRIGRGDAGGAGARACSETARV
jgi:hypothetical protein